MRVLSHPHTPTSLPWHSPILAHGSFTGPRASPPTDAWQGHSLGSWSCDSFHAYCLVDDLVPGNSGGGCLVGWYCCSFYGLQTPSAPSVLSLTSSLETPCSDQWLSVSIRFCICQALKEPLRRQLYQDPVRKYFLAATIVSGFGVCIWDRAPCGAVSGWPFFQSLL